MISDPGIGPDHPRVAVALRTPPNQRSAGGVEVSTLCVAVSTRGITIFVHGWLELYGHGIIFNPGMFSYPPRVALALRNPANR